jgi:hypothetical protein
LIKVCFLITLLLSLAISPGHGSFNRPFDEYSSDLCWEDEKPRLDNFAIALQMAPTVIGDIIVYDGELACRGEAVARALRAKKYLVEHGGVEARRVVWRWGGYYGYQGATTLSITPYGASPWEITLGMPRDKVTFVGNCNGRIRPVKCPKA